MTASELATLLMRTPEDRILHAHVVLKVNAGRVEVINVVPTGEGRDAVTISAYDQNSDGTD
jgi:hypothetical protein